MAIRNDQTARPKGAISRVAGGIRSTQALIRDAGRLSEILGVLYRYGFGEVVERLNLGENTLVRRLAPSAVNQTIDESIAAPERAAAAIEALGPTFIKLGQVLSTRSDLLPEDYLLAFKKLQDDVRTEPTPVMRAELEATYGRPLEEVFAEFDDEPLAAASIAQVYTARLKPEGDDAAPGPAVVLKVRRPDVQKIIERDLSLMNFLARRVDAAIPEAKILDLPGVVREFERSLLAELDFEAEARHIERFQRMFASRPFVKIPDVYKDLSGPNVICMERISGVKITDSTGPQADGSGGHDPRELVERCTDILVTMVLREGFFHGDLHPGNLLVRADGTLCFLDVGLCGRLSPRQRDYLTDLLVAIVQQDYEAVARIFWNMTLHGKDSTADYHTFEADVVENAERWFFGRTMADIEFGKILTDLFNLALRHRTRMPPDYTMTFKAVMTMEGVGKQLQPDLDLLTAAQPYVTKLVARRYQPRRMLETGYAAVRDFAEVLGTVPETTRTVLDDLRAGRTQINVESRQLDAWRRGYAHTQHRQTVGMLAGVAALCGTLALDYGAATPLGVPLLSLGFFVLAGSLGCWYLLIGRRV